MRMDEWRRFEKDTARLGLDPCFYLPDEDDVFDRSDVVLSLSGWIAAFYELLPTDQCKTLWKRKSRNESRLAHMHAMLSAHAKEFLKRKFLES